jgi:hypothetical protein
VVAGVWGRCGVVMLTSMFSFEAPGALLSCGFGVLACGYVRDSTRMGRVSHLNVDDSDVGGRGKEAD